MMTDTALIIKPIVKPTEILTQIHSGQLFRVAGTRGSALIVCHRYHAEIAGPGAAVGGAFDIGCRRVIPIGKMGLLYPESRSERQQAYVMRHKWIGFTLKAMETYIPLQRAKTILWLFEKYFGSTIVSKIPDDLLSQFVGVLPRTISMARQDNQSHCESSRSLMVVSS